MDSLLLIPDISGFTQFVNETEGEHGRHIVSELLEIIIDSAGLGLTVAEIEGDAVLFYLKDEVPPLDKIVEMAERMFVNFHTHLKQYESKRICHCGACTSAQSLSLKVIAHAGPIEFIAVKDFLKPFGQDMIVVHRLLKNSVKENEYLLVSGHWSSSALSESYDLPGWANFSQGSDAYDGVGEIQYHIAPMAELYKKVPEPESVEDFGRMPNPISASIYVELAVSDAYERISNLDLRLDYVQGVDEMNYDADRVNRVGTKHQCVVRGDLIDFETVSADFGPKKLVYGERLMNPPIVKDAAVFTLLEAEGTGTRIQQEFHYHSKPFPFSLLTPVFRFFSKKQLQKSLAQFEEYAKTLSSDAVAA